MSLSALSNLNVRDEPLRPVLTKIQTWVETHPRAKFLDPFELVRDCQVSPGDLTSALLRLVDLHALEVRYKAQNPATESLTDKTFKSPLKFDDDLYDAGENHFTADTAEPVPVYVGAGQQ